MASTLVVHLLAISHPCHAVQAALDAKGLAYEPVMLQPGPHIEEMQRIYGEGRRTVPGMLVDGEPVHGSTAIMERLDELAPEPVLFPSDAVREATAWADGELQDLARRIPWGALQFRPEALGTYGGAGPLDPAGVDFALRFVRATWKHHGITAVRLAEDLAGLPALLDRVDALVADGIVGGEKPNAADLQLGATLRVLLSVGDVRPLVASRPAAELAARWLGPLPGEVPAGAFPAGWI